MKSKTMSKLKRTVSGILALTMTASMATVLPASAEEEQPSKYPYAIFAADDQGGITLNLDSFTLNGNGYTNGVFEATAQYPNINGTISVNDEIEADETVTDGEDIDDSFDVSKDMIFIHNKLMDSWFTENCQTYDDDYSFSDMNINLNTPVYVTGRLSYDGNVSLNTAIGAVSDVTLTGGNLNGNNAVIYSKFGDIKITDSQASMNGLIYAPFGTVTIDCDNFNMDGMIIAQNVVIDSYGANINYSSSWAEFVGTETEELSWTFDDWQYLADTDEDGLPNLIEKEIGTDQYDPDSDGDLLPDGYEVLTLGTDPLKPDTDDNGISDYDEDFDGDGLTNGQEYELGTNPYVEDTDGDNLLDGDEINTYFTNPLEVDTDGDGLNDDDEIYFGTDPNDPDSDDNGILDGAEKRFQTFIHKVENDDCVITEVRVSMEATGNLQKTTTVKSVMNRDILCTDVVGLVGEPFSIETTSEFDTATLTYVIDKDKLGDTEFDNLMFLWYNEENKEFVDLESILDSENSLVSIKTTHFSKYMVVDKIEWFENWRSIYTSYYNVLSNAPSRTAICVDCSGSMSTNDPITIIPPSSAPYLPIYDCERHKAVAYFIMSAYDNDKASIITFDNTAQSVCEMTKNKDDLYWASASFYNKGGTNANAAIDIAIDQLIKEGGNRSIILLSDGDVNVSQSNLDRAISYNIKIHTIGLGSGASNYKLIEYSNKTGGTHFASITANQLKAIYENLIYMNKTDFSSLTDTDEDGLPDVMEEVLGIPLPNGRLVFTDPELPDTDGDDLSDGEEVNQSLYIQKMYSLMIGEDAEPLEIFVFKPTSDPTKIDTDNDELNDYDELVNATDAFNDDTDGDGLLDGEDPNKNHPNIYYRYNRQSALDYALNWGEGRNPEYREYSTDCANFVSQCIFNGEIAMNKDWYCYYNGVESVEDFLLSLDWLKFRFTDNDKYIEDWDIAPAWRLAQKQYEYFSGQLFCEKEYTVESADDIEYLVNNGLIEPGDLAYCSDDQIKHWGRNPYHATFISYVENDNIYYAAHTENYVKRDMKQALKDNEDYNMKFTIIHMKDLIIYE
mgnify:CR=1 FL=1